MFVCRGCNKEQNVCGLATEELYEAEADLPQKAAPKRRLAAPKATDDDDDWGNDDLGDVLPPM